MKRAVTLILLLLTATTQFAVCDEFPIMGYYYPSVSPEQSELMDRYDSILNSIGLTAYVSNYDIGYAQLQKAGEHGLKVDLNTRTWISDSGMFWPTHYLEFANQFGQFVPMQIRQVSCFSWNWTLEQL